MNRCAMGGGNPSLPHWKTRLYRIWSAMKQRCGNPRTISYPHYGGRGIKVCKEWTDFSEFRAWALSNGYRDDRSIDRIDVDGDYCPENCRWSTFSQQANNKTNNRVIEFNGKRLTSRQWDRECGFRDGLVSDRLNTLGWDLKRALTEASGMSHAAVLSYQGESHTISEWAAILGISNASLYARLRRAGGSPEMAFQKLALGRANLITYNGKTQPLQTWAEEAGMSMDTLWKRLKCSHWSVEKALTTPVRHYRRKQAIEQAI